MTAAMKPRAGTTATRGLAWDKTWFPHDLLAEGGRIEVDLGDRPDKAWGVGPEAAPSSEGPPVG